MSDIAGRELRAVIAENGGYWSEHPDYPVDDWRYQVANNDTRAGYWEWVAQESYYEED